MCLCPCLFKNLLLNSFTRRSTSNPDLEKKTILRKIQYNLEPCVGTPVRRVRKARAATAPDRPSRPCPCRSTRWRRRWWQPPSAAPIRPCCPSGACRPGSRPTSARPSSSSTSSTRRTQAPTSRSISPPSPRAHR